jgi:hypothetical protein
MRKMQNISMMEDDMGIANGILQDASSCGPLI